MLKLRTFALAAALLICTGALGAIPPCEMISQGAECGPVHVDTSPPCAAPYVEHEGHCLLPAPLFNDDFNLKPLCNVGQAQIGMRCFNLPAKTIVLPIDGCGYDMSAVGNMLVIKIIQCKG